MIYVNAGTAKGSRVYRGYDSGSYYNLLTPLSAIIGIDEVKLRAITING